MQEEKEREIRKPSLALSLITLLGSVAFILIGTTVFDASLALMFFLVWIIVFAVGLYLGNSYKDLESGAIDMMKTSLQPTMIILVVGAMIGAWIASGTVPAIIYYGLKIINPNLFLPFTMVLCFLTAMVTGTSWGTIGTSGLAMVGVGLGMGMNPGMVAGAAVSGSFLGAKMSPLGDAAIVDSGLVKVPLTTHIRHMIPTAIPGIVISLVLYAILGLRYAQSSLDYSRIESITHDLAAVFKMGFVPLIPAIFLLILLIMHKPSFTSILLGAVVGLVIAVVWQGEPLSNVLKVMYEGYVVKSDSKFLTTILNRGGMLNMADTTFVMLGAFGYAGIMKKAGILDAVIQPLTARIKSVFGLVSTTFLLVAAFLLTGGTMTFASVMTGTLMLPLYRKWRLRPENLSRSMEDCSTMLGPMIPYGVNALYVSSMFGIAPMQFIPFAFLNMLIPLTTLIFGLFNINMTRYGDDEEIPVSQAEST